MYTLTKKEIRNQKKMAKATIKPKRFKPINEDNPIDASLPEDIQLILFNSTKDIYNQLTHNNVSTSSWKITQLTPQEANETKNINTSFYITDQIGNTIYSYNKKRYSAEMINNYDKFWLIDFSKQIKFTYDSVTLNLNEITLITERPQLTQNQSSLSIFFDNELFVSSFRYTLYHRGTKKYSVQKSLINNLSLKEFIFFFKVIVLKDSDLIDEVFEEFVDRDISEIHRSDFSIDDPYFRDRLAILEMSEL